MPCFDSRAVVLLAQGAPEVVVVVLVPAGEVLVRTSSSASFLACLAVLVRVSALVSVSPGPGLEF